MQAEKKISDRETSGDTSQGFPTKISKTPPIRMMLTNYGLRVLMDMGQNERGPAWIKEREIKYLIGFTESPTVPLSKSAACTRLTRRGIIEPVRAWMTEGEVDLRYRRNPLENVSQAVFEFTTRCNFNCHHCYNAGVDRVPLPNLKKMKHVADELLDMGIRQFAFIGGEVSKYGDGWLELVEHIRSQDSNSYLALVTNGWWLEEQDFKAAGSSYANDRAYLTRLSECGVTHVMFSLDGPEHIHDKSRGHPGLFRRVISGLSRVKKAGIVPRVSLVLPSRWRESAEFQNFILEVANKLYRFKGSTSAQLRVDRLMKDRANIISNAIDIGNGAQAGGSTWKIAAIQKNQLYCKGFYRMCPEITIKANGELSTCRVATAGEGYGNVLEEGLIPVLNNMQNAFVFRIHAERTLVDWLPFVDTSIFGKSFEHICALRAIVTLVARYMNEENAAPDDSDAIKRINNRVAVQTGHRQKLSR